METVSYLPTVVALGPVLVVAVMLTLRRPQILPEVRGGRFGLVVAATILAQAMHFLEELEGGLEVALPALIGAPPLPRSVFIVFNVCWLVIWVASLAGARAGWTPAVALLWFLALAMILNLLLHPLLALRAGGFFPGLWTSPLVGIGGLLCLRELARVTSPADD